MMSDKPAKVDHFGLTVALQVWAFEVFSDVGHLCAEYKLDADTIRPRMFRWECKELKKYSEVQPLFEDIKMVQMAQNFDKEENATVMNARYSYNTICMALISPTFGNRPPVQRQLNFQLVDGMGKIANLSNGTMVAETSDVMAKYAFTTPSNFQPTLKQEIPTKVSTSKKEQPRDDELLSRLSQKCDRLEKMLLAKAKSDDALMQVCNSTHSKIVNISKTMVEVV